MTANTTSGMQFAFVDGTAQGAPLGHFLELYEDHASIRGFYAMVEDAAKDWNGEAPLRSL